MIAMMGSEVFFRGSWDGYEWKIVDYDTFRSVYIELPQNHPYYGRDYNDVPIDCHGGLTYSGPLNGDGKYWIGWDYMYDRCMSIGEIKDVICALKAASGSTGPTIWEEVRAMDKEAFADCSIVSILAQKKPHGETTRPHGSIRRLKLRARTNFWTNGGD